MNLFKRKSRQNKYDRFYDEDGYFIDVPIHFEDNDNYYADSDNKINPSQGKSSHKNKHKEYKEYVDYETNETQWEDEYYENYELDNFYSYDDDTKVRQPVNIKILTILFLYIIFLILGIFNTTFENGYVPQIINAKVKSQRVIYYKVMDEIKFLESLDDFKGIQELQELSQTRHYQERIPPLQASLKKVNAELESLQARAYKIKETDYLKVEMMYMINDLLMSEAETLQLAIKYYQQLSGYASPNNPQLIELQNQLIEQHNQYKTKIANYKVRLEQIKINDLMIFD